MDEPLAPRPALPPLRSVPDRPAQQPGWVKCSVCDTHWYSVCCESVCLSVSVNTVRDFHQTANSTRIGKSEEVTIMAYRGQGAGVVGRPMDGGDPRTPMAWQHRDQHMQGGSSRGRAEARTSPGRNGGYTYREQGGGGHTPASRRAKSQERYSRSQSRERGGR